MDVTHKDTVLHLDNAFRQATIHGAWDVFSCVIVKKKHPTISWSVSPMILHCAFSLTSSVEYPNMFSYFFPSLSTLLPGSALLKDGQIVYSTLLHLCCIQPAGTIVPFLRISQIWLLHKQCHSLRWRSTLSELDSLTLRLHLGEMLRFTLHGGMFSFTTVTNSWACIRKLSKTS